MPPAASEAFSGWDSDVGRQIGPRTVGRWEATVR